MNTRLLFWLFAADAFFIALHLAFGGSYDLFNLDRERTPASLWSALQLAGCFAGLVIVTVVTHGPSIKKILWGVAASMFLFLSFDEISELHENAAYYLVKYFPPFPFLRSGTPMWIVFLSPAIIASFALLVWVIRALFRHRPSLGWCSALGLVLFVCALALEFVGGISSLQLFNPVFVVLEEGAELLAGSLFLCAFYSFAKDRFAASISPRA